MDVILSLITLFGGLGLFLYGTNLTSEGLQKETASKMNDFITKLTNNKYTAVLTGVLITVFLQSSSATTVLLVSFVSASLLTLSQALGIILGAAVGTTFTVQLIAFNVTDYALFFVGLGACLKLFATSERWKNIGLAVLGFGFLFYGMGLMADAMLPLRSYPLFLDILITLSEKPILMILVSTIFTSIVQSSAATIALAMSLSLQGSIPVEATLPIVFGANIGTTTTALISSLTSSREAKKVAIAHLIFKVTGVLIFLPFMSIFNHFNIMLTNDIARQIANAHTIFNIVNTLTFLPFTTHFARIMDKILPNLEKDQRMLVSHLDEKVIDVPELALKLAKNEVLHMSQLVNKQIKLIPKIINEKCLICIKKINNYEINLDYLHKEISKYLTTITQRNLTRTQSITGIKLLYIANDLEHLSDLSARMANLAHKMSNLHMDISPDDWKNLKDMHLLIEENFHKTMYAFQHSDLKLAAEVVKSHPKALRLEKSLRYCHFTKTNKISDRDVDISSIHLDLINHYLHIHNHLVSIAQAVMGNM